MSAPAFACCVASPAKGGPARGHYERGPVALELGTFFVNQVIIHSIPKVNRANKDEHEPVLSDVPSPLTDDLKLYMRERIKRSVEKQHFIAVYDPPTDRGDDEEGPRLASPVPKLVIEFFETEGENLVEMSQQMARHLYDLQAGSSSQGMLVVADGVIGTGKDAGRVLSVLKLEMDNALTITPATDKNGRSTFEVEVHDITLKKEARVFKAALFERPTSLSDLRAYVSDNQRDSGDFGDEVAKFFISTFLGCRLRDTAERATKNMLGIIEGFAAKVADQEAAANIVLAAMVELNSSSDLFDPRAFAQQAMPAPLRDEFLATIAAEDGSVASITKDTALIGDRLKNVIYEFSDGLRVIGPRDAIRDKLKRTKDGWTIDAELKHMGSRSHLR